MGALFNSIEREGKCPCLYPQGLEVMAACGCLTVVSSPSPCLHLRWQAEANLAQIMIAMDAQASFVLRTTSAIPSPVEEFREQIPEFQAMRWIDTEQAALEPEWSSSR